MSQKKISSGVVHEVPADLKKALTSDPQALTAWEDITPLARNEWICWIESAKKVEIRSRRIEWGCSSVKDGKRRLSFAKIQIRLNKQSGEACNIVTRAKIQGRGVLAKDSG
jgi:hypothetical protein